MECEQMTFEDVAFMTLGKDEQRPKWPAEPIDPTATVAAVGALRDTGHVRQSGSERSYFRVRIDDFVEMSNVVRFSIPWDRGVTVPWGSDDGWLSEPELLAHLEGGLLPDEGEGDDAGELRPWHEYALLLHARGIPVTAEQLRELPYLTEFSSELSKLLIPTEYPPS